MAENKNSSGFSENQFSASFTLYSQIVITIMSNYMIVITTTTIM
jgi:hypothetical protein